MHCRVVNVNLVHSRHQNCKRVEEDGLIEWKINIKLAALPFRFQIERRFEQTVLIYKLFSQRVQEMIIHINKPTSNEN